MLFITENQCKSMKGLCFYHMKIKEGLTLAEGELLIIAVRTPRA